MSHLSIIKPKSLKELTPLPPQGNDISVNNVHLVNLHFVNLTFGQLLHLVNCYQNVNWYISSQYIWSTDTNTYKIGQF